MELPIVQRNSTLQGKSAIIKVFYYYYYFFSQRMWLIYKEVNEHYKFEEGKEFSDLDYYFLLCIFTASQTPPLAKDRGFNWHYNLVKPLSERDFYLPL